MCTRNGFFCNESRRVALPQNTTWHEHRIRIIHRAGRAHILASSTSSPYHPATPGFIFATPQRYTIFSCFFFFISYSLWTMRVRQHLFKIVTSTFVWIRHTRDTVRREDIEPVWILGWDDTGFLKFDTQNTVNRMYVLLSPSRFPFFKPKPLCSSGSKNEASSRLAGRNIAPNPFDRILSLSWEVIEYWDSGLLGPTSDVLA